MSYERRASIKSSENCFQFSVDYGYYDPVMCGSIDGTDDRAHDRALVRASQSTYKPNRRVRGKPEYTLFVGRLCLETSEETVRKRFEKYGEIYRLRLVRDLVTGISKGYAFVEFKHRSDAQRAHRECYRGMVIDEREVIVEFELERSLEDWKPRRLGGGFGGRKESGQLRFGGRYKPFNKIPQPPPPPQQQQQQSYRRTSSPHSKRPRW